MIESSEFYNRLNRLEAARVDGITNLASKGVIISPNASIPTIVDRILSISGNATNTTIETNGNAVIIAAELPGVSLVLKNSQEEMITSKTTDAEIGGAVTFELDSSDKETYTITALNSDGTELWANTITIDGVGVYNCKTGKAFNDYTPEEINLAAKNHYAKYMWSVGDVKNITILGSSKPFIIGGFEHDEKADGTGKTGITLIMKEYTSSSYKHYSSNNNKIGWEGSLIRQNCLKVGDLYYLRDESVTASTQGTRFVYNTETDTWVEKTLPTDFDANEYYYTQNTMVEDGAFITGLPDFANYIVPVVKETADAGQNYKKIIKSIDQIFLLSDGEVFGNSGRYSKYSQYELEGKQYDYYKNNFTDGKVRASSGWWLRSPYSSSATSFCYVYNYGYVYTNYASSGIYARLAFCL